MKELSIAIILKQCPTLEKIDQKYFSLEKIDQKYF